ncbi:MAG: protein kinase [Akkermansiaceae bacterium]
MAAKEGDPDTRAELCEHYWYPLCAYVRRRGANQHDAEDLTSRLQLFLDACAAVTHAHQKNLIHRDLKPSNILVGRSLKVIDFIPPSIKSTR